MLLQFFWHFAAALNLIRTLREKGHEVRVVCPDADRAGEPGYVVRVSPNGFGGAIDMMVGISADGTVTGVAIVSQSETASLGANCTREDFRAQFTGRSGTLAVSKDGGEIDALTGATVTSRAVTQGVNTALAFVKEVLE